MSTCQRCGKDLIWCDGRIYKFCSKCRKFGKPKKQTVWDIIICKNCGTDFVIFENNKKQVFCTRWCECNFRTNKRDALLYSISTACKCGCGGVILNPDDHYRYKKFIKNHQFKNGHHPRLGVKESEEHVEMRVSKIHLHFKDHVTCLERQLYEYLDSIGIEYEKQKQVGRTVPDAFIPELELAIYADGNYWHSTPKAVEQDKRCDDTCRAKGMKVMRLPSIDNGFVLDLTALVLYLS